MNKIDFPHIYKKGKTLRLKDLDVPTQKKEYTFSSSEKGGVQSIANLCNNLNQITARCWLNTLKINHYFGIQKDISEDISKNKKPFNQFKKDLTDTLKNRGGVEEKPNQFVLISTQLENQNKLIHKVINLVENNSKHLEKSKYLDNLQRDVAEKAFLEDILKSFDQRLKNVQDQLKQLMG